MQALFEDLLQQDEFALEGMDTYSNILYMKEDFANLSGLAHKAVLTDKYRPETCCIIGNYYSLKAQHDKVPLRTVAQLLLLCVYAVCFLSAGFWVNTVAPARCMHAPLPAIRAPGGSYSVRAQQSGCLRPYWGLLQALRYHPAICEFNSLIIACMRMRGSLCRTHAF